MNEPDPNMRDCIIAGYKKYNANVVDRYLKKLKVKFDELFPCDFSILNGRLPIVPLEMSKIPSMPLRGVTYANTAHDAKAPTSDEVPPSDILKAGQTSMRAFFPILNDKLYLENTKGSKKLQVDTTSTNVAFQLLAAKKGP